MWVAMERAGFAGGPQSSRGGDGRRTDRGAVHESAGVEEAMRGLPKEDLGVTMETARSTLRVSGDEGAWRGCDLSPDRT
jgi:hypothetical protein